MFTFLKTRVTYTAVTTPGS